MLTEIKNVRQSANEPHRRWFSDEQFDLIVWIEDDRSVHGFQLCYKKADVENALTWMKGQGFFHNRIDDGESLPNHHKMTPILVADGAFDRDGVLARFAESSSHIDPELAALVMARLTDYPVERKATP